MCDTGLVDVWRSPLVSCHTEHLGLEGNNASHDAAAEACDTSWRTPGKRWWPQTAPKM